MLDSLTPPKQGFLAGRILLTLLPHNLLGFEGVCGRRVSQGSRGVCPVPGRYRRTVPLELRMNESFSI